MASGTIKAVVGRSDIVNNLNTNDATKVLSAKQGKTLNDNINKSVIGSSPIAIDVNTDLNTITTPGYYICAYNSTAATLSNCPVSIAFTMQVIRGTADGNAIQILIEYYSGNIYKRIKRSTTWEPWSSLDDNIKNGYLVAKYLNDTSKTAIQLLTADFSNVNLGDIQFYRIRPSDDNLYGFIVKHSATYAYGLFAGTNTGDSYNVVNLNGTWTKTKLATDSETSISMTAESIIGSVDTYNRCIVCGNVVTVAISAVVTANNGWKKAFTLAQNVGPVTDVYFPLINSTTRQIAGYAYVNKTEVSVDVSASGDKLRGSCTFIKGA